MTVETKGAWIEPDKQIAATKINEAKQEIEWRAYKIVETFGCLHYTWLDLE